MSTHSTNKRQTKLTNNPSIYYIEEVLKIILFILMRKNDFFWHFGTNTCKISISKENVQRICIILSRKILSKIIYRNFTYKCHDIQT